MESLYEAEGFDSILEELREVKRNLDFLFCAVQTQNQVLEQVLKKINGYYPQPVGISVATPL